MSFWLVAGAAVPGGGLGAQRVVVVLDAAAVLVAAHALQSGRGGWDEEVSRSVGLYKGHHYIKNVVLKKQ